MKNLIVMGATGAGLFCATVAGLLGVQGRLNYEGTKNIPVLNSLFTAPLPSADGEAGEDGDHPKTAAGQTDDHAGGTKGHEKPGDEEHGDESHGDGGHDKKSKEPQTKYEYVQGKSINAPPPDEGGGGHGGGDEAAQGGDAHGEGKPKKSRKTPSRPDHKTPEQERQAKLQREFERKKQWLHSIDDRYRGPGDLFEMPRIKAGMSVEEINSVVSRAQSMMKDVERKQAVLEEQRLNLEVRERDIADRQGRVDKLINQVQEERTKVEQAIEEFNKRVLYLRPQEESGLKEIARTVASLTSDAAKELIMNYWRTPEGQNKAIKILAVMDKEKVDLIIAEMETQTMREILEKRMTIVRLEQGKR